MKIRMGEFADGFAWFVEDEDKIVEVGWNQNLKQARNDAEAAAWFWQTHDYENESNN